MITLQVENKCQNCDNFYPTVDVRCIGDELPRLQQTVYCRNKNFCKNLENYLEKTIKK